MKPAAGRQAAGVIQAESGVCANPNSETIIADGGRACRTLSPCC